MQTFSQGEVNFFAVPSIPQGATELVPPEAGRYVVGHSESGNLHVLDAPGVTVVRRPGADILYAIVAEPGTTLRQEKAGHPHTPISVPAGTYEVVISREIDPFSDQIRTVSD